MFGYDLSREYSAIQPEYSSDVSCQGSVPESIICFLESVDYEDAIRHAIAMGGDPDTIAATCGSIAAPFYGDIPQSILIHCKNRITNDINQIIDLCK